MNPVEIDRRAQELYNGKLRTSVESPNRGRFIAIDVNTGDYEIGDDRLAMATVLRSRSPAEKSARVKER